MFDYKNQTRDYYKDDAVAAAYHNEFTNLRGLNGFRFRFVARRERATVRRLLEMLPARSRLLDIPCGTGKMAPVFFRVGAAVVACDISENMLSLARKTYEAAGVHEVEFGVVDLEHAVEQLDTRFDITVCVRLMHRVPDDVKRRMLQQIARISTYAIVSFGVSSFYEGFRRTVRRSIMGGRDVGHSTQPRRAGVELLVAERFDVLQKRAIAPWLSAEHVYLLKAK